MARLLREDQLIDEVSLDYAGESSTFSGRIRLPEPGGYILEILGIDADRQNFGRVTRMILAE